MDKSDHKLEPFIPFGLGQWMFTFSHKRKLEDNAYIHEFDHIIIDAQSRDRAIAGLVARRFTFADEIALINNKLSAQTGADEEYNSYMLYREECKSLADLSISGHEEVE